MTKPNLNHWTTWEGVDEYEISIVANGIGVTIYGEVELPEWCVEAVRRAAIRAISDLDTARARRHRHRAVKEGLLPVGSVNGDEPTIG